MKKNKQSDEESEKLVIANEIKNMHSVVNEQIPCSRRISANKTRCCH